MSLTQHGTWRNVDLSYNNLGSGSAIVLGELVEMLGRRTAELIGCGLYTKAWDLEARPAGKVWGAGCGALAGIWACGRPARCGVRGVERLWDFGHAERSHAS
eukprot:366321-Chlamydomonas_euryale.AAC.1